MTTVAPFLMFVGRAEEAIDFYVSVLPGSEVLELVRHGAGAPAGEGKVMKAVVSLAGQNVIFSDSPDVHAFTFTPSTSLFVECDTESDVDRIAAALGKDGGVLMPVGNYGFSKRFGWVVDRFGVSWQVNFS